MFGIFKKTSKTKKLYKRYRFLLEEAKTLSTSNRALSDQKYAEAQDVLREIESMDDEK
jgi:ribosomal protein L32